MGNYKGGTSSERMGDFVDIQTEVQRWSIEDLYTTMIRSRIRCSMKEHMERYKVHVDIDGGMEKACGGEMMAKEAMWNIIT